MIRKPKIDNIVEISRIYPQFKYSIMSDIDLEQLNIEFYAFMKKNDFNPIAIDIQFNPYKSINVFLEFLDIDDCWKCFNYINDKTLMNCSLNKYMQYQQSYSMGKLYRRLPTCIICKKERAKYCNKEYCGSCVKSQPHFNEVFYTLPYEIFSNVIMKHLNVVDICSLQKSCRKMNSYLYDNAIWNTLFLNQVPDEKKIRTIALLTQNNSILEFISNQDITEYNLLKERRHYCFKKIFMCSEKIKTKRLHTKSITIIQKYVRRLKCKRDYCLKYNDAYNYLTGYCDKFDYTRSINIVMKLGTDFQTKTKFEEFAKLSKMKLEYNKALNMIEEPTFD